MVNHDTVLDVVKSKGPVIPVNIKNELQGGNTTLIGAILSELAARKLVLISSTKIGGSPFYYTPEQKEKLQELKKYLNEKDLRTYDLLKDRKVLRDSTQTPLVRVSLRAIKDFAVPLQVKVKGEMMLFWKWYLTPNSEAEVLIKKMLSIKEEPQVKKQQEVPEVKPAQETPKKTQVREYPKEEKPKEEKEPVKEVKKEKPKETQKTIEKEDFIVKDIDKATKKFDDDDEFFKKLSKYFDKNDIDILEREIIRKKSEIDFVLRVPSSLGMIDYFCKAKSKKKCNDGDLASCYVEAQARKLPGLFLTEGVLTKKAREMIDKKFKGLIVKEEI